MISIILYEVCLPFLIGFLLVRAVAPRAGTVLAGCLGLGIGMGAVSSCYFIALLTGLPPVVLEPVLVLGIVFIWWRTAPGRVRLDRMKPFSRLEFGLGIAFAVLFCCGIAGWVARLRVAPHGTWDAWSDWNLRARFLTTAYWRDGFSPVLLWTHPGYPLLLPGFVARAWQFTGGWQTAVPAVAAFLFTFGTVGLLAGSLALLKGRPHGLLAGIFLLGTPYFITEVGVAQIADIPISFFILATLALLAAYDRFESDTQGLLALAGLTAGMAAWTKNEGLLMILAIVLARSAMAFRTGRGRMLIRQGRYFALGLAPLAVLIAVFKHLFATPDAHLGKSAALILTMVADKTRYAELSQAMMTHTLAFGGQRIGLFIALSVWLACAGLDTRKNRTGVQAAVGTLGIMLAGYYVVYLITPFAIDWQVTASLDRVLLQLWPAIIFTAFLAAHVPTPEPPSPPALI